LEPGTLRYVCQRHVLILTRKLSRAEPPAIDRREHLDGAKYARDAAVHRAGLWRT